MGGRARGTGVAGGFSRATKRREQEGRRGDPNGEVEGGRTEERRPAGEAQRPVHAGAPGEAASEQLLGAARRLGIASIPHAFCRHGPRLAVRLELLLRRVSQPGGPPRRHQLRHHHRLRPLARKHLRAVVAGGGVWSLLLQTCAVYRSDRA